MDDRTRERVAENRTHWEELAAVHPDTEFYDVEGFLAGESTLLPPEHEEFGPHVGPGTRLLHLQCHFGLDTLSWAREGAEVVGVDFAETAVETARELAVETGLDDRAAFVRSDLYDLPEVLDERFDAVFTSYGVLCWLPDIERWAETVARFVAPGGRFYIVENHPMTMALAEDSTPEAMRFAYPYFGGERLTVEAEGSYADPDADLESERSHQYAHSLGEILTALLDAGLELEFVHEHPFCEFAAVEGMEADEAGRWWLPELEHDLPFLFSVLARKPAR